MAWSASGVKFEGEEYPDTGRPHLHGSAFNSLLLTVMHGPFMDFYWEPDEVPSIRENVASGLDKVKHERPDLLFAHELTLTFLDNCIEQELGVEGGG